MPTILDGKALAQKIREEVRQSVTVLKAEGITPRLQVALVGDFAPSLIYVRNKEKACAEVGIASETVRLPAGTTQAELLSLVQEWNQNPHVQGVLIQMPLPEQIDPNAILAALDPKKDVDGLTPFNLGRIVQGEPYFYPATPSGILEMLCRYDIIIPGKHVVIVGRGELVGKPLANMLLQKSNTGNATVTICHTRTRDLGRHTREADIVVAAAGRANLIRADMIRKQAIVIERRHQPNRRRRRHPAGG